MTKFSAVARDPKTPLASMYSRVFASCRRAASSASGEERRAYSEASSHVVAASVCSEDGDLLGVKANLSQAMALVAAYEFKIGGAA